MSQDRWSEAWANGFQRSMGSGAGLCVSRCLLTPASQRYVIIAQRRHGLCLAGALHFSIQAHLILRVLHFTVAIIRQI